MKIQAYLHKNPANFGQLFHTKAISLGTRGLVGSLSYGRERAPSRLVFGRFIGRQIVSPAGETLQFFYGRAQRAKLSAEHVFGFLPRTHLKSEHARTQPKGGLMCMCTRLPARAILSTSAVSTDAVLTADSAHVVSPAAFSDAALSAAAYIPPASCRLCRRLSPTSWYTAGRYTAGTRPAGSSRSDRIGSARIGSALLGSFDLNRHGGRHISTWLSAGMGTDRRPPLHLFFSAQLALGSAQLGSARLGWRGLACSARSAQRARLRSTRFSPWRCSWSLPPACAAQTRRGGAAL